jgi:hypothetical protein
VSIGKSGRQERVVGRQVVWKQRGGDWHVWKAGACSRQVVLQVGVAEQEGRVGWRGRKICMSVFYLNT